MKKLLFLVLPLFFLLPVQAESSEGPLRSSLVTVGAGDPLYVWFGHTGLMVENSDTGRSVFYDFGNFSFQSDNFYRNFAMGRLIYSSVAVSARAYLDYIVTENRDVTVQTLNLSQEAIREMEEYLTWKVQPGNNTYLYHHYLDNCSTRIRDLIDQAVDGQLKEATAAPAGISFRQSFRRFSHSAWWTDWLLSFLQGRSIDEEISLWDTMFLPQELMHHVGALRIQTPRGEEPLVLNTEILLRAEGREIIPATPPSNRGLALFYGLIGGAVLLLLQTGSLSKNRKTRRLCRILLSLLLLFLSLGGCLFFFISFFTDHLVTRENLNVLLIHPLYLVLIFLYHRKSSARRRKGILRFWQFQSVLYIATILINILSAFGQDNQRTLFFFLPLLLLQAILLPRFLPREATAGRPSGLLNQATAMRPGPDGPDGP